MSNNIYKISCGGKEFIQNFCFCFAPKYHYKHTFKAHTCIYISNEQSALSISHYLFLCLLFLSHLSPHCLLRVTAIISSSSPAHWLIFSLAPLWVFQPLLFRAADLWVQVENRLPHISVSVLHRDTKYPLIYLHHQLQ